ncbi:MAG: putative membrane protein [uncultured Friedmanniella sp.]|uniref:Putative membrane protein n=1 Tax=uncultured Friedmanniella sp. TaxID=335381 RepID=A0A6J4L2S9_9ACTN|nr:MAG: putative membrane protein [uncultured Friedmanniella sp.]
MDCPRCRAALPAVAHFCQVCGLDQRSGDTDRRHSFAAKPDEPVASFALISSIMPRGAGQRPQTYRLALTVSLAVALVAAIFGAMPIAVLVAAFAIPVVYVVYLYDVNLWEDEPLPVTALAFLLTGGLALVFTVLWTFLRGPVPFAPTGLDGTLSAAPRLGTFLLVAVLVPVVGELIRQVGPVMLASRPQFDDLMDGLTFGVVSGVAYACFDTLVRHWDLLTGGLQDQNAGLWASLVFLEGFVKPLVMGTATGLACAEFSGLGRGYDGFTPRYVRAVLLAVLANVAYQVGTYLFSFVGSPTLAVLLSVLWGLLILGVLILRLRTVLHTGLMEAALERSARERGVGETGELQFCGRCEMPLHEHAAFCNACGTAVRVQAKPERAAAPAPALAGAAPTASGGTTAVGPAEGEPDGGPPPSPGETTEVRRPVFGEEDRA